MRNKIIQLARAIHRQPSKRLLWYYRSPRWQQRRRQHLNSYPLCQICGWRKGMQVHHWRYDNLGREEPWELCTVCVYDHHLLHCAVFEPAANDNFQLSLPLSDTADDDEVL